MASKTVKSIETALNLIDAKKDNLKKAFEELQSRSGLLSSFTINWPDLDSYFTSLQSELLHKFSALKNLESSKTPKSIPVTQKDSSFTELVHARPELISLCQNMDGLGLRKYLIDLPREINTITVEIGDALKHAPDPGSMILDAIEGFCHGKISVESRFRTVCVLLLEELMKAEVEISPEVQERARAVAAEWQGNMEVAANGNEGKKEGGVIERLGYLHLLAAYKLFTDDTREVNELIDFVVSVSKYRQAVNLSRTLGIESRISDVIQRLIMKGKQLIALKFIFEFGLSDQFPPVPLLKACLADSRKIAQNVRKSGKNYRQALNEAAVKEINALKSVIMCIKDNNLESLYPTHHLVERIEKLEKEQADRKKAVPKPQRKPNLLKQNEKKRTRTAGAPSADKRKHSANSHPPPSQPSFANRASLLTDQVASYLSQPAGSYGIAGSFVSAVPNPYAAAVGPYSDQYGLSGAPPGFSVNHNPAASNPYPSQTHAQPGHYDSAVGYAYSGYDVQSQYHPVYYPQ